MFNMGIWLVVYLPTPLKNDGVKVSWTYSYKYMKKIKCSKPPPSAIPIPVIIHHHYSNHVFTRNIDAEIPSNYLGFDS
jgi:hypothetical protein